MNLFDKICAACSFLLGVLLLLLGAVGLFKGCNAHFALPAIFGVIPAFIGWGIVRPVFLAWRASGAETYMPAPRSVGVGSPIPSLGTSGQQTQDDEVRKAS